MATKTVRSYFRKTKSGKKVKVRQHLKSVGSKSRRRVRINKK